MVSLLTHFPLTLALALSPAFAEAAMRRPAPGERVITKVIF
jgi:hypothetical protein